MENKPQSVFDRLEAQEEKLDVLSEKFEGVSLNDLYALAKRTWNYGDYVTAQKYYNHISLLNPLDWKAPLYASICNFKGYKDVFLHAKHPKQAQKVFVSTLEYIMDLSIELSQKEKEMEKCIIIIEEAIDSFVDLYFKNQRVFDDSVPTYISSLIDCILHIYINTEKINLTCVNDFRRYLADSCILLMIKTKSISNNITNEVYDKLYDSSSKRQKINYDDFRLDNQKYKTEKLSNMSLEEADEIKLKGKKYFFFSDKVVARRLFLKNLIFGVLLIISSISGIIISLIEKWYFIYTLVFSLFIGVILIIKAVSQKDKVNCFSFLSNERIKVRRTSNGNIIEEEKINILRFISILGIYIVTIGGIFLCFHDASIEIIISMLINILIYDISIFSILLSNQRLVGYYQYFYKGKYYSLSD